MNSNILFPVKQNPLTEYFREQGDPITEKRGLLSEKPDLPRILSLNF